MLGVQGLPGRAEYGVAPVLAGSGTEESFYEVASHDLVFVEGAVGYVLFEMVAELGGDHVPQHVVVVVDGGDRHVNLGRPIGFVSVFISEEAIHVRAVAV